LKDRVFQVFRDHIKKSIILNGTRERLKSGDYIDSEAENVSLDQIRTAIFSNINEYKKWVTDFSKELPGLKKFNQNDLGNMISNCALISISIHINEFFKNGECYQITPDGLQLSRNRMNAGFGSLMTFLFFLTNEKLRNLELSPNEKALFYPFSLFSAKSNYLFILYSISHIKF
jgi:hypothetical protein